jgi:predicted RNA binding protein YcfA (HicA-like mRNA interferase family)
MRQITGKELAKLIEDQGWRLYRIKGSHHIYKHPVRKEHISIPIHGSRPLALGLARHLLKIAGLVIE